MRERYICQSASCRREAAIIAQPGQPVEHSTYPRCACGSPMKRAYANPNLREVSGVEAMVCLGYSLPVRVKAQKC